MPEPKRKPRKHGQLLVTDYRHSAKRKHIPPASLPGQGQMIYLDPPYAIKSASNFQPETCSASKRRRVGTMRLLHNIGTLKRGSARRIGLFYELLA